MTGLGACPRGARRDEHPVRLPAPARPAGAGGGGERAERGPVGRGTGAGLSAALFPDAVMARRRDGKLETVESMLNSDSRIGP